MGRKENKQNWDKVVEDQLADKVWMNEMDEWNGIEMVYFILSVK